MPDSIAPVGAQIQAPNPMQGINTYSGILGLQQQQQNLQTGQYQQQTAQANAQQDQQKNQELQTAQQLVINGSKSGQYDDGNGGLDRQKMANDLLKVAPTYGQPIMSSLLSQANEIMSNRQAHQDLTVSQKKEMGATMGSLAADPEVDNTKVIDAIEKLRAAHPNDPEYSRLLTSQAMHLPSTGDPKVLQDYLGRWAAASTGDTQVKPGTIDTGAQIQPGAVNQFTGAFKPAGAAINKPPASVQGPGGQILNRNPQTGALSLPPTATSGANLNPTRAQAETQQGLAGAVTQRVSQAQAAANNTTQAQDALSRAREILDQPDSPKTGAGFQRVQGLRNLMSTMGIDTQGATDANSLVKNLARYEAARATQAGLGGTDAARELAHNGSPNVSVDNNALKGIVTQSLATEKALSAYANVQSKNRDPDALAKNESDFRSIPNLIQGYEYGLARNPKEAEQFLQKHGLNRADMAKTRQAIKEFESRGQ